MNIDVKLELFNLNIYIEVRDELDILDLLVLCGHTALGLTFEQAREIDPDYTAHDYEPPNTMPTTYLQVP